MPRLRRLITTKRIVLIALCTLLGVATSYGVAWWLLHRADRLGRMVTPYHGMNADNFTRRSFIGGFGWDRSSIVTSYILSESDLDSLMPTPRGRFGLPLPVRPNLVENFGPQIVRNRLFCGWPFRCASTIYDPVPIAAPMWAAPTAAPTLVPPIPPISHGMRPDRPLWPGLLANTAIYGSAWLLVLTGVPATYRFIRTRRRNARGQCTTCGYDRAGISSDAVCPECGTNPT